MAELYVDDNATEAAVSEIDYDTDHSFTESVNLKKLYKSIYYSTKQDETNAQTNDDDHNSAKKRSEFDFVPQVIFGISTLTKSSVDFIDDNCLLYPSGCYFTKFKINESESEHVYIDNFEYEYVQHVFGEKKLIVIEELVREKVNLRIFDMKKRSFIKTIDHVSNEFLVDLKISTDNTRLLTQTCGEQWKLGVWSIEKGELQCSVNVIDSNEFPANTVTEISFYPNDKNKILAIGKCIISSYLVNNDELRLVWHKSHSNYYICHTWSNLNEVLIGTDEGQILFFDVTKADFINTYSLPPNEMLNEIEKNKIVESQLEGSPNNEEKSDEKEAKQLDTTLKCEVNNLIKFSSGIIALSRKNNIVVYKKIDDVYKVTNVIKIPTDQQLSDRSKFGRHSFIKILLNKSETILICFTNWNRIYKLNFNNGTENRLDQTLSLLSTFHFDKITGMDICVRKPLIVTCGQDNTVNIWNYEDGKLEYYEIFDQELFSVAFHPSGLYLAIASFEKIHYNVVYYNEFKSIHIFSIGHSLNCAFSFGGQYFAAINTNSVVTFSTVTYEQKIQLRAYTGKILDFMWTNNDQYIIACTSSGIICVWDVDSGEKIGEYIAKGLKFSTISMFDNRSNDDFYEILALDNNNGVHQLSLLQSYPRDSGRKQSNKGGDLIYNKIIKFNSNDSEQISTICCDSVGVVLILCTKSGQLSVIRNMNSKKLKQKYVYGHVSSMLKAKFSFNNRNLVTCSNDGTMIVWRQHAMQNYQTPAGAAVPWFNQILITRSELQTINANAFSVHEKLEAQKDNEEYELKLKEMTQSEKIKALNYNCKVNLGAMRSLLKEFKFEDDMKSKSLEERLKRLIAIFEKDLDNIEENSEQKLIKMYHEFDFLSKTYEELVKAKNEAINDTNLDFKNSIEFQDIEAYYSYRVEELEKIHKKEISDIQYQLKIYEAENREIEIITDKEIETLKKKYERRVNFLQKDNDALQLETCFIIKKLFDDEDKMKQLLEKEKVFSEFLLYKEKKNEEVEERIKKLKYILSTKTNELIERDQTAFQLKANVQHLGKLRTINEHKINEFHKNTDPLRQNHENLIQELTEIEQKSEDLSHYLKRLNDKKALLSQFLTIKEENLKQLEKKKLKAASLKKRIYLTIKDLLDLSMNRTSAKEKLLEISKLLPKTDRKVYVDSEAMIEFESQKSYLKGILKKYEQKLKENEQLTKKSLSPHVEKFLSMSKHLQYQKDRIARLKAQLHDIQKSHGITNFNPTRLANMFVSVIELMDKYDKTMNEKNEHQKQLIELQTKTINLLKQQCHILSRHLKHTPLNENLDCLSIIKKYEKTE